jgi:hypothetical protein
LSIEEAITFCPEGCQGNPLSFYFSLKVNAFKPQSITFGEDGFQSETHLLDVALKANAFGRRLHQRALEDMLFGKIATHWWNGYKSALNQPPHSFPPYDFRGKICLSSFGYHPKVPIHPPGNDGNPRPNCRKENFP